MTNLLTQLAPTFKSLALAFMLSEANQSVEKLNLPEDKPVTSQKLVTTYITPENIFVQDGVMGVIETQKFAYSFGGGGKITTIGRLDFLCPGRMSEKELTAAYRKIAVPESQIDTNAAWQAMQPYLKAGVLGVEKLNQKCQFRLKFLKWGDLNVPIYSATWLRNESSVASIKLLMPDKILLSLIIDEPEFNLRSGFQISNVRSNSAATKLGQDQ